jgi:hypothetical protein
MARQQLTDLDFNNVARIINLPNPQADQDAATMGYVKSIVEGLAWKDSVRVATQGNINLSSPGATIDGIAMAAGDRVLVRSQTTASENGIYIWNGASTAMTRSLDANTAAELEQAVVTVEEGSSAGATFRQTNVNFTLGTDPVNWTTFGTSAPAATETTAGIAEIATQAETDAGTDDQRIVTPLKLANWSGRIRKVAALIGDGSATQFTVTHNLNTRDVHVAVYRNSGAYDQVNVDIEHTTATTVTIRFASAPGIDAFRVVVMG